MTKESGFTGFRIAPSAEWSEEELAQEARLKAEGHYESLPLDSQPAESNLVPASELVIPGGRKRKRRGTGVTYEGLRLPVTIAFRFPAGTPAIAAIEEAGLPAKKNAPS